MARPHLVPLNPRLAAMLRTIALTATAMVAFAANSVLARLALAGSTIDDAPNASVRERNGWEKNPPASIWACKRFSTRLRSAASGPHASFRYKARVAGSGKSSALLKIVSAEC